MAARTAARRIEAHACLSRPAFETALNAALKKQALEKEAVASLLLVDIDDLLGLNAKHGHDAGDRAIAAVTSTLGAVAKGEGWTFGRLGGDEFALLAEGIALEPAFLRAEALRREVDAAIAKALPSAQRRTVTIGVASAPRDTRGRGPEAAAELLRKADLALHSAKEQGGNAVGLTPADDMVLKSSYYSAAQLGRLKGLAERMKKKEAMLLREALDDLLRKYDRS
jgi:diguanylate cyclase (GGDEF)-like protein